MNIPTEADIKKRYKSKIRKPIICMRCTNLKFQKRVKHITNFQLITQQKHQKDIKVMADFVSDFDHTGIMNFIKQRIHFRDVIFKIVVSANSPISQDITDFEGTVLPEIFEMAVENKCMVMLVVNKIDCLPKHVSMDRIHKWVQKMMQPYKKDLVCSRC